ncbi:hypothetical protein AAVH_28548 [Aphelenchoides avenae]|nr:hypothetical protein AAVH_28548 [Aphelenchus avenae]
MGAVISSVAKAFKVTAEFIVETLRSMFKHFFATIQKLGTELSTRIGGTARFKKASKNIFMDNAEHIVTTVKKGAHYVFTVVNAET